MNILIALIKHSGLGFLFIHVFFVTQNSILFKRGSCDLIIDCTVEGMLHSKELQKIIKVLMHFYIQNHNPNGQFFFTELKVYVILLKPTIIILKLL